MNELEKAIEQAILSKKCLYQPSLKAFAFAVHAKPVQIYTVAKIPVVGQIYDARVFNWTEIEKFISRRLDPDVGIATLPDVVNMAILEEQKLAMSDRRSKKRPEATGKIELNGKLIPARRTEVAIDTVVQFKDDEHSYKIVYFTATHIVFQVDDTSELLCLGNWTFNSRVKQA